MRTEIEIGIQLGPDDLHVNVPASSASASIMLSTFPVMTSLPSFAHVMAAPSASGGSHVTLTEDPYGVRMVAGGGFMTAQTEID